MKKHILVVCDAGLSSTYLVVRMQEEAKKMGYTVQVWAVGESDVQSHWRDADILMIGPQVRYLKSKFEAMVEGSIPVVAIDTSDFGLMNGLAVLEKAQEAMAVYQYQGKQEE